jgi:hypothetical protein
MCKASAQGTHFLRQHEAKDTLLTQQEAKNALSYTSNTPSCREQRLSFLRDKFLFWKNTFHCNQVPSLQYIRTVD